MKSKNSRDELEFFQTHLPPLEQEWTRPCSTAFLLPVRNTDTWNSTGTQAIRQPALCHQSVNSLFKLFRICQLTLIRMANDEKESCCVWRLNGFNCLKYEAIWKKYIFLFFDVLILIFFEKFQQSKNKICHRPHLWLLDQLEKENGHYIFYAFLVRGVQRAIFVRVKGTVHSLNLHSCRSTVGLTIRL